ncbi:hypothetical protein ACFX12_030749 [Malus domestica]
MTIQFEKNRKKRGISADHGIGKHRKHLEGHGNTEGMHHHQIRGISIKLEAKDNALLIDGTQYNFFKVWERVCCHNTNPLLRLSSSYFQGDRVGDQTDLEGAASELIKIVVSQFWSNTELERNS